MKKYFILFLLLLVGCTNNRTHENIGISKTNRKKKDNLYKFYTDWKGTPYKFGGTTRNGIDCSAFVRELYINVYEISLPRDTRSQIKRGESIKYAERDTGDLVFFKTGSNSYHVGVYYENDNFIHASTSKGVMISNLNETYWVSKIIDVRRVEN